QRPTAKHRIENFVIQRKSFAASYGQIIGAVDLDGVPYVKQRFTIRGCEISQRQEVHALVLIVGGNVGKALTPGPVKAPGQPLRETLPELNLQAVVVVPAGVVDIVQAVADEWIEQEEIYRVRPGRVGRGQHASAGTKGATEHATGIVLIRRQRAGQRSGRAIGQVVDEASGLISGSGYDSCQSTPSAESCVKDRQRKLTGATEVLEALHAGSLV